MEEKNKEGVPMQLENEQENSKDEKHLEKFSKEEKQMIKLMAKIFTDHFFNSADN